MSTSSGRLEGKVALVTGAGRGIGQAIALAYAAEGARVGCAARTVSEIDDTVAQITKQGGVSLAIEADVTDLNSVQSMVDVTVEAFGGLDILVANAGGGLDRNRIEDGDPEEWIATIDVNLIGAYYSAKVAIPHLKHRGAGKIITVGSGMGHNGRPGSSAYACAKAGLWMLTRVLAQELEEYNISVNELVPGPVLTGRRVREYAQREDSVFSLPEEWVKTPDDVTDLALFLATQPDRGPTAQSFSLMRRDV